MISIGWFGVTINFFVPALVTHCTFLWGAVCVKIQFHVKIKIGGDLYQVHTDIY